MPGHFEAKKHAYRQTQEGVVVSFVVHPNDLDAGFAVAALGTRYMVAFAEIGDDEKPIEKGGDPSVPVSRDPVERPQSAEAQAGAVTPKDRKPFASLPLSQQAALRCQDNDFKLFLGASNAEDAAHILRRKCGISSRSELNHECNMPRWIEIERQFQSWLTDQRYAEARR